MTSRVAFDVTDLTQTAVCKLVDEARRRQWLIVAQPDDIARLHSASACQAGKIYDIVPSDVVDTLVSRSDFVTEVACRLGVDVTVGGYSCKFCGMVVDGRGRHPLSCMAGGDTTILHNQVGDCVLD